MSSRVIWWLRRTFRWRRMSLPKEEKLTNPRGELYTDANVGERLAVRNMLDGLRGEGRIMGGPSNFTMRDRQAFANQLDLPCG